MIIEDYVSPETAKLLQEKGFDWMESPFYSEQDIDEWKQNNNYTIPNTSYNPDLPFDSETITLIAPHVSLQLAMKWLREVYNVLLVIDYEWECDASPYYFKIFRLGENGKPERIEIKGVSYDKDCNPTEHIVGYRDWERSKCDYSNYEQACEAAIKYCLEKCIDYKNIF